MAYLAVPIGAKDLGQASEQIKAACEAGAEMLELRTAYLEQLNAGTLKALLGRAKAAGLPLIVTCRDSAQGGVGDLPLELRVEVLAEAIKAGVDFVDCEHENFVNETVNDKLKAALDLSKDWGGTGLILSAHNFEKAYSKEELLQLYKDMKEVFPEAICKIVYKAEHINDCFDGFDLLARKGEEAIVLCMGQAGQISRILAKKLGAFLTFASVDQASATAPGQVTVREMKDLYRWDKISAETEVFGVIGNPVGHSLSPAIFNSCLGAENRDAVYLPFLVEGGADGFNGLMRSVVERPGLGVRGFSVTIPHKSNALEYVKSVGGNVELLAEKIGAVNTIRIDSDGKVSGFNTDYAGAIDALVSVVGSKDNLNGCNAGVVGAGGVARAVVAGLVDLGAEVTIYNRTVERGRLLAEEFGCKHGGLDGLKKMEAEILINCTSVGMHPDIESSPVPTDCLRPDMVVFDTVYNPLQTQLLKEAGSLGAKIINGAEMFMRQAMAQHKIFTGSDADDQIMRKTVFDHLGS